VRSGKFVNQDMLVANKHPRTVRLTEILRSKPIFRQVVI